MLYICCVMKEQILYDTKYYGCIQMIFQRHLTDEKN